MSSGGQQYYAAAPPAQQWSHAPQGYNQQSATNGFNGGVAPGGGAGFNGSYPVAPVQNGFSSSDGANGFYSSNATNGYPQNNGFRSSQQTYSNGYANQNSQSNHIISSNEEPADWVNQTSASDSQEKNLFSLANSGINFDNYDNIPVNVSGDSAPDPIDSFEDAKLHEFVMSNVTKSGYSKPTPVQKYSIPTLLGNLDLMSCAQTGSGKTAAFLLPIINHILVNGPEGIKAPTMNSAGRRCFYPAALVLSPTRELAIQIHKEATKFSYRTNIVTSILYGGRENYRDQIARLRNGCHILIATPGRLIDILEQGYVGLAGCRYLVLDEADRMLDMGFEPQIRKIVQQGQMPDKNNRITAMFSATFAKSIQELAQDFLRQNYVFLAVGRVGSTSENIDQEHAWVEEHDKKRALLEILEREEQNTLVLVFVETKRGSNELAYFLQRQQIRAVPIHGDLKQFDRERNLAMFSSGQNPVLVATAVAARGLDIPNVRHVINYDLPGDIDEYVHRIGRTGRCGNTGRATSFFNDKNRGIGRDLAQLVVESNKEVPDWLARVAAEGRPAGRSNRGRFGGTDHRRGGSNFSRGGGYNGGNNSYGAQQNGAGMPSGYGGYSSNGASRGFGGHRGVAPQAPYAAQNGYAGSYHRGGGFGAVSAGFGGMMGGGFGGGFAPPAAFGNGMGGPFVPPGQMPAQQRGFGNWQQQARN